MLRPLSLGGLTRIEATHLKTAPSQPLSRQKAPGSQHYYLSLRTVVTEPERAATRIALHLRPRPEGGWVGFFMEKLTEED